MLFDSPAYILFLSIVVLVYWRLSWRAQNHFLLAVSYFFYGWWDWRFLLLMMLSTVVDFIMANKIATETNDRKRKMFLTLSLVMNFGFLGVFKYCNFFVGSLSNLLVSLGVRQVPVEMLSIVLPPGISFYTFQEVAYIVDVYYRRLQPARSIVDYSLFISLFPHLIAGPIQRPSHLLPQVQHPRVRDNRKLFDGCMLILLGLFRKCMIADNCALLANAAFNGKIGSNTLAVAIGIYAFAWQIYSDFSGYSDIARGSAQLLGFHFMVNFRQPYFATSLQDFWRRWHISLSTWLRDYLYIPLGGNRKGESRTYVNLLTTMLLGGLWHGANWTFIIWGGIHGGWLAIERYVSGGDARWLERRGLKLLGRVVTLSIVGLAWVFFRASSFHAAIEFLSGLGHFVWKPGYGAAMIYLAALTSIPLLIDMRLERTDEEYPFQNARWPVPVAVSIALAVVIVLFGATDANAFIYFQF